MWNVQIVLLHFYDILLQTKFIHHSFQLTEKRFNFQRAFKVKNIERKYF